MATAGNIIISYDIIMVNKAHDPIMKYWKELGLIRSH